MIVYIYLIYWFYMVLCVFLFFEHSRRLFIAMFSCFMVFLLLNLIVFGDVWWFWMVLFFGIFSLAKNLVFVLEAKETLSHFSSMLGPSFLVFGANFFAFWRANDFWGGQKSLMKSWACEVLLVCETNTIFFAHPKPFSSHSPKVS